MRLPSSHPPSTTSFFVQKHSLYTVTHAGSLGQQRRASRNCEEPALKLLASRQQPINSLGQPAITQKHLQPITHTHSLIQVKEGYSRRAKHREMWGENTKTNTIPTVVTHTTKTATGDQPHRGVQQPPHKRHHCVVSTIHKCCQFTP